MDLVAKRRRATAILDDCGSVVVALSGGVDSAVLLSLAMQALGRERVLAATGHSGSLAAADLAAARRVAASLEAPHVLVPTAELGRPGYRANAGDRCFHCRSELFEALDRLARDRGLEAVVYGAIADDRHDARPGMLAAERLGVRAPLLEAGFDKEDVRSLAAEAALPVASRPSNACLASRIPVGTEVTADRLARIERAETALADLGFGRLRVRDHGEIARLELDPAGLGRLADPGLRERVARALRASGFRFATIDLEGYRPGGAVGGGPIEAPAQRTSPTRESGQ
jgi:uncharacterized protein